MTSLLARALPAGAKPQPAPRLPRVHGSPPPAFLCPITSRLMEWPHITTAGTTYEHGAIRTWLEQSATDPQTNLALASTALIPNLGLRSQIRNGSAFTRRSP